MVKDSKEKTYERHELLNYLQNVRGITHYLIINGLTEGSSIYAVAELGGELSLVLY